MQKKKQHPQVISILIGGKNNPQIGGLYRFMPFGFSTLPSWVPRNCPGGSLSASCSLGPFRSSWRRLHISCLGARVQWICREEWNLENLGFSCGGFLQWGTPIAGWFISWEIPHISYMDENWGRGDTILDWGNLHVFFFHAENMKKTWKMLDDHGL